MTDFHGHPNTVDRSQRLVRQRQMLRATVVCRKCGIDNLGNGGLNICHQKAPPESHDFSMPIQNRGKAFLNDKIIN